MQTNLILEFRKQGFYFLSLPLCVGELGCVGQLAGTLPGRSSMWMARYLGSAQQSVKGCILRGFLESDEFGLGGCQALGLQQQVIEIAVTPTTA
jgi:hypothetical protein